MVLVHLIICIWTSKLREEGKSIIILIISCCFFMLCMCLCMYLHIYSCLCVSEGLNEWESVCVRVHV